MDPLTLLLHAVVLAAALLQTATGIGFGVIAGPVILLALNSGSAIQVSILLNLFISVLLAPFLMGRLKKNLLMRLLIGTAIGMPVGIVIFQLVSVDVLKLLAGLAVLLMALSTMGLFRSAKADNGNSREHRADYIIGVLSGAMSSALAMPGPVVAAHMSGRAHNKEAIRATILIMFVFSFGAALGFQAALVGVAGETWLLTAKLLPATLAGMILGRFVLSWINEQIFRRLIILVLLATSISLLINAVQSLWLA